MAVRAIAAARRAPRAPRTFGRSTPAPVGGWNARDALSDMDERDAVTLDNWFPGTSTVMLRGGQAAHATGLTTAVESLMPYADGTKTELFAAANSAIYDVTSSGAVGAAKVSSLTNNRWQHVNFGTSADEFLIAVNGADSMQQYDGTTWRTITDVSSPAITGVTTANLAHLNVFKTRLFLIEINKLSFWYLGAGANSGAATEFNLGTYCRLGGSTMAMGTWTRDSGDGVDDLAVFVTSEGEVLIFSGTDPGNASAWALIGRFEIGAPIGRRCMIKAGSELIIITVDGIAPLSRLLRTARTDERANLTDKISGAFEAAARDYGANFGWQGILYPRGNKVLFNIPTVAGSASHQYVANTTTGAWCRFTGWNAFSWAVFNDELYMGGAGVVDKADTGLSDKGANIETEAKTAFTYLGQRGRTKKFNMVRPNFITDGGIEPALTVNVDFEDTPPTGVASFTPGEGAEWDVADWDEADWGSSGQPVVDWIPVAGTGYAAAIYLRTASNANVIEWSSTDWLWEQGGVL